MVTVTLMVPISPDTWEKAKHVPESKPRAGTCCHEPHTPSPRISLRMQLPPGTVPSCAWLLALAPCPGTRQLALISPPGRDFLEWP